MLTSGEKASDIVREKLLASGGTAVIPLQRGEPCTIMLVDKECAITSDKLNGFRYGLSVFDVIVELLQHSPQGKARKGNSRGPEDKVGRGRCTEDTVVGAIAIHYKVPKEWLLEFLTSEDYNSITRKSKEHYAMIAAVAPKPRKPRKKS